MRGVPRAAVTMIVAVIAVGCTSFDDIDPDVCGNGIIEKGEDCDRDDATCVRCAQTCETRADCPSAAYTCGVDGVCAAPSGRLADPSPIGTFPIDDFVVTDLDRDGIGDLMGTAPTSLVVRYGDAAARLDRGESRLTPSHAGPAAYGDIDGDGAIDVSFATADGLISYGSKFGLPTPLAVRAAFSSGSDDLDLRTVYNLGTRALVALIFNDEQGISAIGVLDQYNPAEVFTIPCAQRLQETVAIEDLPIDEIDLYEASPTDYVMSLVIDTVPRKLCTLAFHLDTTSPILSQQTWTITDITPTSFPVPATKPLLLDLDYDFDNCPGLLNADSGAALAFAEGQIGGGRCTIANTAGTAIPSFGSPILGRLPLDPPILTIGGDLLVSRDGVFGRSLLAGDVWVPLYESQRALRGSDAANLDLDDKVDGVLYGETDDVDILYRRANAENGFPSFIVYRVDTTNSVSRTKIGDFDANGFPDLAMIEELGDFVQMSVAYGQLGFLRQPVSIATFQSVFQLVSGTFPSSEDLAGITEDLIVLQPPAPGKTVNSVTILSGSTAGTLIPYFDPRNDDATMVPEAEQDRRRTRLDAVVVGRFVEGNKPALDMLALASELRNDTAPLLWRMLGTEYGPDATITAPIPTEGFADCVQRAATGLCLRDATYFSWPTGATSPDIVFAVDRENPPHAVRFDPSLSLVQALPIVPLVEALTDKAPVRSFARADLDGDEAFEIVVMAADGNSSRPSALVVCEVDDNVPSACTDIMPAVLSSAAAESANVRVCADAVVTRMQFRDRVTDPGAVLDLVLACRTDEGSVILRADRTGANVVELARTSSSITTLRTGDVTGDGLDDILIVEAARGVETMSVLRQCSSRDIALCGGGQ